MKNIHLPALGGLATTLGGLLLSPVVLNVIPPKWAAVIVTAGSLWQSVTKALQKSAPVPATDAPPTGGS